MNDGVVASFGCGHLHPAQPMIVCTRQRHHAGDHRAPHGKRLLDWPDPPYVRPLEQPPMAEDPWLDAPVVTVRPRQAGKAAEARLEDVSLERTATRHPSAGFWGIMVYIELVVLVVLAICAPAIIVAVYRAAI